MMDSQGDKGAESEGYKKQTPSSTNPQQQNSIQVNETAPTDKTTPPKEKPTATSNQLPKHKRTTKSPNNTANQDTTQFQS